MTQINKILIKNDKELQKSMIGRADIDVQMSSNSFCGIGQDIIKPGNSA